MDFDYHFMKFKVTCIYLLTPDVIQVAASSIYTVTSMSNKAVNYQSALRHGLISYDVTVDERKRQQASNRLRQYYGLCLQ